MVAFGALPESLMKIGTRKHWTIVFTAIAAVVVAWLAFDLFLAKRFDLWRAVSLLRAGKDTKGAMERLLAVNDRGRVLDALTGALEKEDDPVEGKRAILSALAEFKELRPLRAALDSKVPETRRAAAQLLWDDADRKDDARRVALEWMRDPKARSRDQAIQLVRFAKLEEAVPDLLAILDRPARTPDEKAILRASLDALTAFQPEGLTPKLFAFAKDRNQDLLVRNESIRLLGRLQKGPVPETRDLLVSILTSREEHKDLRAQAALALASPRFEGPEAVAAFEKVLLDPAEKESIVQRSCLREGLGRFATPERLREILLDPAVYNNRYFGIRVDVACGLASLAVKNRVALDILTEYLVDSDPQDALHLLRQEAWVSLWSLTGLVHGVENKQLFLNPPPARPAPDRTRIWDYEHLRMGVSKSQTDAVKQLIGDLGKMKAVRETFRKFYGEIEAKWEEERTRAEAPPPGKEGGAGEEGKKPSDAAVGPTAPNDPQKPSTPPQAPPGAGEGGTPKEGG